MEVFREAFQVSEIAQSLEGGGLKWRVSLRNSSGHVCQLVVATIAKLKIGTSVDVTVTETGDADG